MSNEYKDWLDGLENSPIGSHDHNQWLCIQYPWLIPRNRYTGEIIHDFDYQNTELDSLPVGWRMSFAEEMCEQINQVITRTKNQDWTYRILDIKEKFGELRIYCNGVPEDISAEYESIIRYFQEISRRTCVRCGRAIVYTEPYSLPVCDICFKVK